MLTDMTYVTPEDLFIFSLFYESHAVKLKLFT